MSVNNMRSRAEIQELLEQVHRQSPLETETVYSSGTQDLSRFANNEIRQNISQGSESLAIRTIIDGKSGVVSTGRLDTESIQRAVEQAVASARLQKADPECLPLQEQLEIKEQTRVDEETAALSPEDKAEAIRQVVDGLAGQKLEAAGIFSNSNSQFAIGNSNGMFHHHAATDAEFSITVSDGGEVSGWAESISRRVADLDTNALATEAIEIYRRALNPEPIDPGEYTVVLPPAAVTDFLLFLTWLGFGGQDYLEGTSPLSGKLGEQIAGSNITILDDPFHDRMSSAPFDGEGLPKKTLPFIEEGVLRQVAHDRRTANRSGLTSTGHGFPAPNPNGGYPTNLCLQPGEATIEEMIASTERGLLVTHFHYTNVVNPRDLSLTGMTRDGVFRIEDGKLTRPVHNLRFTDSVLRILNQVEMIGRDTNYASAFFGGGFVVPALKVNGFKFSSTTNF
ncbi:MAG: TldD/PmbA family protein [Candidatus Delongbacteria bacterium]|nr:TldD/PmbA family protein [Candidatus Delongbacteria bacterium]